jgi:hypothetical protein
MTHIINPKITVKQRCIIIGTILGGSSIVMPQKGKNCYLSMRSKNLNWLNFKSKELSNLATKEPITTEKTYRWHSVCYPLFNEFHEMFYKNKKRILNINTLNLLQDLSIAVWFKDCGILNKNNTITFNTHIWGKSGSEVICEYFNSLEWKSNIFTERKNYRVKIDEEASKEILKMYSNLEENK